MRMFVCLAIAALAIQANASDFSQSVAGHWKPTGQFCSYTDRHSTPEYTMSVNPDLTFTFEMAVGKSCVLKKAGKIVVPPEGVNLTATCMTKVESSGTCPAYIIDHVKLMNKQKDYCFNVYYIPSVDAKSITIIEPSDLDGLYCPKGENLIQSFKRIE